MCAGNFCTDPSQRWTSTIKGGDGALSVPSSFVFVDNIFLRLLIIFLSFFLPSSSPSSNGPNNLSFSSCMDGNFLYFLEEEDDCFFLINLYIMNSYIYIYMDRLVIYMDTVIHKGKANRKVVWRRWLGFVFVFIR